MKNLITSSGSWKQPAHRGATWVGVLLVLAGMLLAGPAARGQALGPATTYSTGAGSVPFRLALGDLNNDGRPDLVTANSQASTVGVLLGQAGGGFAAVVPYSTYGYTTGAQPVNNPPYAVVLGDLNGDGRLDIVTAHRDLRNPRVAVLLAQAGGGYSAAASYLVAPLGTADSNGYFQTAPTDIALADVNGDGKLDVVATVYGSPGLGVLLGTGTGTLGSPTNYYGGTYTGQRLSLRDVTGDGRLDAVTAAYSGVLVWPGQAGGSFGAPTTYPASTGNSGSNIGLAIGDVTGDGRLDVLFTNYSANTVGMLAGQAGGTLGTAVTTYATGTGSAPQALALGDVTADNLADLVTANTGTHTAGVLPGQATGFGAATAYSSGSTSAADPFDVLLGDFNSDGHLDVAVANGNASTVGVLLYQVPPQPTISSFAPGSGLAGSTSVVVTGTNLTGATAVTFNGVAASGYTVNAAGTQLTVTVPAGATTGPVAVTTAGGTATSSTSFTVLNPTSAFAYTGSPQTYTVPAGVTRLRVVAQGGGYSSGKGGVATAVLAVTPGEVLTVVAGGAGTAGLSSAPYTSGQGGYNGGGNGGSIVGGSLNGGYKGGDGGHGASDLRRIAAATAASPLAGGTLATTATSRLLVAGGAGGGGADAGAQLNGFQNGGGASAGAGGAGGNPSFTATQTDPTAPSYNYGGSGSLGQGGAGGLGMGSSAPNPDNFGGNGGGGGYYGGGGGAGGGYGTCGCSYHVTGAGGGGSSYAVPAALASGSTPTYTLATARFDGSTNNGGLTLTPVFATPTLTSLAPSSGAVGSTITINGTDLGGTTTITFAGSSGNTVTTGYTVNAAGTQLTGVVVPSGAATGSLTVTTPGGVSNGLTFTVTLPPADLTISTGTLASPTAVAAGTYNSLTVTGSGVAQLSGATTVNGSLSVSGTLLTACQPLTGAASFTLAAGATLGICDPAGLSNAAGTGAVQTTGTRSFSPDASYVYNGTAAQTTGNALPAQVRSLTTTNNSAVTLTQPTSVAQVLTVGGAGNLALNGQALTLLSSASGTALLVNSGTGLVAGATGVAQRYLATSNLGLGYRQYSAPVGGSTVADLATSGFSPEVSQAATYNSSATPGTTRPYPTVFGYDQGRLASTTNNLSAFNKGWYVPAGTSTPLAVGQGYTVNIAGTELVDFVGTFTSGNQTVSLSRGPDNDAGLALVGNPYPAPLNWSLLDATTDRPGVDGAMYVFASSGQYAGSYRSYVNGQGGNPIVPMGQGFFVRVTPGQSSGSVTFRNSHRLTAPDATAMQRPLDLRPQLVLELRTSDGNTDPLYAYAEAGATAGADAEFDALKLNNPSGLNLSSLAASGEQLAIDGRSEFVAGTELPLQVGVPAAGTYSLAATGLHNLPAGLVPYLRDAATGQSLPLVVGQHYRFQVTAAQATALLTGRFTLVFRTGSALATTAASLAAAVSVYPNPADKAGFTVGVPGVAGASQVQAELLNTLGQVVAHQQAALPASGAALTFPAQALASGVYVLRLTAGAATVTRRVVIE